MTRPQSYGHSRPLLGPVRWARLKLRRADGRIYLNRWGLSIPALGGVFLHRMDAPDPGVDLHDHPWAFVSVVLAGGYTEQRALCRDAPMYASIAERFQTSASPIVEDRHRWSWRLMRLDECHTITHLRDGGRCWTVVLHGPRRRKWGFYLPSGFVDERTYDETVRAERRDLWHEGGAAEVVS